MAVLSFYHIHLPFPGRQCKEQILYLNTEYDVVCIRPRQRKIRDHSYEGFASLLVDFLHDAKAYDYKDQGYIYRLFRALTACICFLDLV